MICCKRITTPDDSFGRANCILERQSVDEGQSGYPRLRGYRGSDAELFRWINDLNYRVEVKIA